MRVSSAVAQWLVLCSRTWDYSLLWVHCTVAQWLLVSAVSQDAYSMFGVQFRADDQIIRPLEAQGLRRLYPHNYDHKRELKKLNYSILVNFLDLLDVLIKVAALVSHVLFIEWQLVMLVIIIMVAPFT